MYTYIYLSIVYDYVEGLNTELLIHTHDSSQYQV